LLQVALTKDLRIDKRARPCGRPRVPIASFSCQRTGSRSWRNLRPNRWRTTKNPASSAGLFRPPRSAGRRNCSLLDSFLSGVRNQPHLWVN
jgi:hypothetical protein